MTPEGPTEFWSRQTELAKAILVGMEGTPELKREERSHFLGEFAERVLASLTREQVRETGIDRQVAAAIEDRRATAVIVSADVPFADAHKYEDLAGKRGIPFTMRGDPELKGPVGLVVVAEEAVT